MRSHLIVTAAACVAVALVVALSWEASQPALPPLVQAQVTIDVPTTQCSIGATSDASGNVHLLLPVGTFSISTYAVVGGKFDTSLAESFDWLEDGPHPRQVKLLLPPSAPR